MGIIILFIVLGIEVGYTVYCLKTKGYQERLKHLCSFSMLGLLILFALFGITGFNFRWNMLHLILLIQSVLGIRYFYLHKNNRKGKKEKIFSRKRVIIACIRRSFLLMTAIIPAIIFPQIKPVEVTGTLPIKTVSYTLTDTSRKESFSQKDTDRKVTIQFWYPEETAQRYPLVVFSHGAFGFRGSNRSTFENLASNGYVVCSIDHTYHSFFTKQEDGNMVIANMDFVNDAMAAQNGDYDEQKTYELSHGWLKLRTEDFNFVLDTILDRITEPDTEEVYRLIDPVHIGVLGHSLGGATAASIGRERSDVDSVIVVDGTMFGEENGYEDGSYILNQEPYPVPLLNLYNEEHYLEAKELGESYDNISATVHALDAREVVFRGAGHINFTDLPMFSPFLAGMLGTGEIDSRYCIEKMNEVILDYFNYYLKNSGTLRLQTEY